MALFEVGRVCVKIAGRDAGERCVIVEVLDAHTVLVDGATRRRKCNVKHLEPLAETLDVKKGATHDAVAKAFTALGVDVKESKPRKATTKPRHAHKAKADAGEQSAVGQPVKAKAPKAEKPKAEPAKAPKAEKADAPKKKVAAKKTE